MTIFTEQPRAPANATFAGGVGSLADIAGAARDSLLYVENANAGYRALSRALDERRTAIHTATGAQLANPLEEAEAEWRRQQTERPRSPFATMRGTEPRETRDEIYDRHLRRFRGELFALGEKFPMARGVIAADRDPWDDAARIARQADEQLSMLMQSRSGLGKYGALLAGGMAGSLGDPVTVMSLFAGGGPGAARTVAGRILTVAGKEMLINAATEAAVQPIVQAWRERAGLDAGMDEAIRNVLFAGAVGGAFGGFGQSAAEGLARLTSASRASGPAALRSGGATDDGRAAVAALESAGIDISRLSEPARAILADDGLRAADSLAELRAVLPAEARGALDAVEASRHADEAKPASATPHGHDSALSRADQAVRLPDALETWPGFEVDAAQVKRVVREISGSSFASRAAGAPAGRANGRDGRSALRASPEEAEPGIVDFLIDRGGVREFRGELAAIGAAPIAERFRGRLVRQDGATLDYAREAAAEAGFFDHLYGDPATAGNRSTVADLLDLLEENVRARTSGPATSAEEAALGTLEATVMEIARMAGPGVDDAVLTRAARLATEEGLDPADALERVLVSDELAAEVPAALPQRTGDPLPGWSDEELLAASEHRGAWPEPDGIDEPGRLAPDDAELRELADLPDDFEIPGDDGVMTAGALREAIEHRENLANLVEACRA